MKIKKLWIVTKPTPVSTLDDILFLADLTTLSMQFKGGLDPDTIHAAYTEKQEAEGIARWLLIQRDHAKESN